MHDLEWFTMCEQVKGCIVQGHLDTVARKKELKSNRFTFLIQFPATILPLLIDTDTFPLLC